MREHRVLKILLCVIVIVFAAHQIYTSAYKPITTVSAEYGTVTEGLPISVTVFREEQIIESDTTGVLHFAVADGERVAKGGTVVNIYSNAEASVTVNQIDQLQSRIKDIEEIQSYNDVEAANLTLANTKINNTLNEMVRSCAAGDFSKYDEISNDLLTNISRKQMITGEQTDFNARLTELKTELDTLNATLPQPIGSIKAAEAGYFVSGVDGYENSLPFDEVEKLTPETLKTVEEGKISAKAIGKIVSGYNWYLVSEVDFEVSTRYKEGDTLRLETTVKSSPTLDVTLEKINSSQDGKTATLIFSCQQMNSELASMRKGNMTIVKNTYSGLKLPTKSLRFQDDKTGVFVRSGITLKFVSVNVIYRTDEYIICEQQVSNSSVLRLYDDVVVKGKRLYDGKIVD